MTLLITALLPTGFHEHPGAAMLNSVRNSGRDSTRPPGQLRTGTGDPHTVTRRRASTSRLIRPCAGWGKLRGPGRPLADPGTTSKTTIVGARCPIRPMVKECRYLVDLQDVDSLVYTCTECGHEHICKLTGSYAPTRTCANCNKSRASRTADGLRRGFSRWRGWSRASYATSSTYQTWRSTSTVSPLLDVHGRARAWRSLVGRDATMSDDDARRIVGLR